MDLDHDKRPDIVATVVKASAQGTEFGVLAVHAQTPTTVQLSRHSLNGVAIDHPAVDTVMPLHCIEYDSNPWFRWNGRSYEPALYAVGDTISIATYERGVTLGTFARPTRNSKLIAKMESCTEAKVLQTHGSSTRPDGTWSKFSFRNHCEDGYQLHLLPKASASARSSNRLPDAWVFVAQASNAQIVGWIHIYTTYLLESDPDAEIGGLVVAEEARGKGVGRILLAAAERWAAELAYPAVRVRSNVVRVQARGFYEHLGYEHIKTQNNFRKALTLSSRDSLGSKRQEAT